MLKVRELSWEMSKDRNCEEFNDSRILAELHEKQKTRRLKKLMRTFVWGERPKPTPIYLKETLDDRDEDVLKVWYRKRWREGGFELIDKLKKEEKRYNKFPGNKWKKEFGHLSEEELGRKKQMWLAIRWVEKNTNWRKCPWDMAHYKSYEEIKTEEEAIERGHYSWE